MLTSHKFCRKLFNSEVKEIVKSTNIEVATLQAEMTKLRSELTAQMATLRVEMTQQFSALQGFCSSRLHQERDIHSTSFVCR